MSNPLVDMEKPDVIFCIGTNMTECHPVAATRIKKAVARGAKLIVADPRRIGLAEYAELYLPLKVGTDAALLLAMAHVIAREELLDSEFIAQRTAGVEEFLNHVENFSPDWAEQITGVPAEEIEKAARWYGQAQQGAIYYTLGITEHICGVDNVQSLCNLALMTGNVGREGTGLNPMRGQNNIQGAGDSGALPNNYPGFQAVDKPENQAKFQDLYGREMDLERGITKVTALDQCGQGIHAMLIDGENTLLSDPDRSHCEHALKSLDHLVVIDIFMTETAELADIVLPATAFAETDGVMTNTERRVQRVRGQLCHHQMRPSQIGGSLANWPNDWISPASIMRVRKKYLMSCVPFPRSILVWIGIGLNIASISGQFLITNTLVHHVCTKSRLLMVGVYLTSSAIAIRLKP